MGQMKNTNAKVKTIEKEKVVAETLNGRFAMLGLIAAVGAYLTTGQIIPGIFLMSPLSGFLAVIVFFTAILVAYLTKQFQNENLNYSSSNQMKNTNTKAK